MRDVLIRLSLTEAAAAAFEGKNAMVVALSDTEIAALRDNINGVDEFLRLVGRAVTTLDQVLETKGTTEPEIAKTLDMIRAPARVAAELHDQARQLLGRAVFVGGEEEKGLLQ